MERTPHWLDSEAGQQLQATLSQGDTLVALNRLVGRIEQLEQSVERLGDLMEKGPGMVSMVTDMADEAISSASDQGIDVESRLQVLLQVADKLTAPATLAKLDGLLSLADQLPGLASMVTDMADEGIQKAADNHIDVEERLSQALSMAEKLTAPETAAKVDQLLTLSDQAPGLVAMVVDIVDETMESETLSEAKTMLSPSTLAILGKAGEALSQTGKQPIPKMGLFKMLGALRKPELKKAAGFLIKFGENFGKKIHSNT